MGETRWRAPDSAVLKSIWFDDISALYHRPSGQTHLLAEPVPQILAALGKETMTLAELLAALAKLHDMEGDSAALTARLSELVASGLLIVE